MSDNSISDLQSMDDPTTDLQDELNSTLQDAQYDLETTVTSTPDGLDLRTATTHHTSSVTLPDDHRSDLKTATAHHTSSATLPEDHRSEIIIALIILVAFLIIIIIGIFVVLMKTDYGYCGILTSRMGCGTKVEIGSIESVGQDPAEGKPSHGTWVPKVSFRFNQSSQQHQSDPVYDRPRFRGKLVNKTGQSLLPPTLPLEAEYPLPETGSGQHSVRENTKENLHFQQQCPSGSVPLIRRGNFQAEGIYDTLPVCKKPKPVRVADTKYSSESCDGTCSENASQLKSTSGEAREECDGEHTCEEETDCQSDIENALSFANVKEIQVMSELDLEGPLPMSIARFNQSSQQHQPNPVYDRPKFHGKLVNEAGQSSLPPTLPLEVEFPLPENGPSEQHSIAENTKENHFQQHCASGSVPLIHRGNFQAEGGIYDTLPIGKRTKPVHVTDAKYYSESCDGTCGQNSSKMKSSSGEVGEKCDGEHTCEEEMDCQSDIETVLSFADIQGIQAMSELELEGPLPMFVIQDTQNMPLAHDNCLQELAAGTSYFEEAASEDPESDALLSMNLNHIPPRGNLTEDQAEESLDVGEKGEEQ